MWVANSKHCQPLCSNILAPYPKNACHSTNFPMAHQWTSQWLLLVVTGDFQTSRKPQWQASTRPSERIPAARAKGTCDNFFCAKFFAAFSEKSREKKILKSENSRKITPGSWLKELLSTVNFYRTVLGLTCISICRMVDEVQGIKYGDIYNS